MDTLLQAFLARHPRTVLLFSAGKDSAACLKMLRPFLDTVLVAWVNPGNPYPETVDYMSQVQRSVPHFQMVLGHQPAFVREHGHPADVIPFEATPEGRIATRSNGPRLVPLQQCCRENLWIPAQRCVREYGATGCIRGDKTSDPLSSGILSGMVIDGVEYLFPLADWSDAQVMDYLGDELPPSYRRGLATSLDCINCTAYLAENPGRIADLRETHPRAYREVEPVIRWMRDAAQRHMNALEAST